MWCCLILATAVQLDSCWNAYMYHCKAKLTTLHESALVARDSLAYQLCKVVSGRALSHRAYHLVR